MTLRAFALSMVLALAACPALSQTVIMGHHIGESVSQFLDAEPDLQGMIGSCRASEPKPMTPEQIHALSKQDVHVIGEQVYAAVLNSPGTRFRVKLERLPSRGELEDLAKQGMPIFIDKRMPDMVAACDSLLALTATASSSPVLVQSLPNSRPRPITWHFKNGALFQIDIDFHGADFATVANDFSAKTGVAPSENQEVDTPNLYGATLHVDRKAIWLTPELYALLVDEEGLADGQMQAFIMGRAEYEAWARSHTQKSSLD